MSDFYSDIDPFACEWTRQLIKAGHIPDGVVSEQSIKEVRPADVVGRRRAHFFNGIAGWGLALELAGFPESRNVWTGSAPCQSFSTAGKQKGFADDRDLWPEFFRLVRECGPDCLIGEQVEGAIRHGWLDRVCTDLAGEGYAVGHAILGAHSLSAPHIRQRLYWVASRPVADAEVHGLGQRAAVAGRGREGVRSQGDGGRLADDGDACRMGDAVGDGLGRDAGGSPGPQGGGERGGLLNGHGREQPRRAGATRGLADAIDEGRRGGTATEAQEELPERGRQHPQPGNIGQLPGRVKRLGGVAGRSFWDAYALIPCRDGKSRRVPAETQSGFQFVASGIPAGVDGVRTPCRSRHPLTTAKIEGRAGLLKGAGNAVCVPTAAAFVRAFLDSESDGAA